MGHFFHIGADSSRTINGIKFTGREFDVLACLINKQKVNKQIAFILSISENNVQFHIGNILTKIGRSYRSQIIDWLEQSVDYQILVDFYQQNLHPERVFKAELERIATSLKKQAQKESSLIIYRKKEYSIFLKRLEAYFSLLDIKFFSINQSKHQNVSHALEELAYIPDICIVIVCDDTAVQHQKQLTETLDSIHKKKQNFPKAIFLTLEDIRKTNLIEKEHLNFNSYSNHYLGFFELFKKIWTEIDFDFSQTIKKFEESCGKIAQIPENGIPQIWREIKESLQMDQKMSGFIYSILKRKIRLLTLFISCLFFYISFLSFYKKDNENILNNIEFLELSVPEESILLDRTVLLKQIHYFFESYAKNSVNIPCIGLVGIGGSGKTTLARLYAKTQKDSFIWEINAETHTRIIESFQHLANALAQTKELHTELMYIKTIQDIDKQEKKLIQFIKKQLKNQKKWILIYDNVEEFTTINNFFPRDSMAWGNGKVILTTRNGYTSHWDYFNPQNIVQVNPLTLEEAGKLFCKIFSHHDFSSLPSQEQKEITQFLEKLPLFPLDISSAARCIKNISLSYEQYIERINSNAQNFHQIQYMLLKEMTDYTETRYGLTALSIHKIIEKNPEYINLLFLISLLDSQEIPLDLLRFYKNEVLIDHFITDLKKYFSVTTFSYKNSHHLSGTVSIHRSEQLNIQAFLTNHIQAETKQELLENYNDMLKRYHTASFYTSYQKLALLIPHLELFLHNITTFKVPIKDKYIQNILYLLGHSYYHGARNFIKERNYFQKVVEIQEKTPYLSDYEYASMLKLMIYVSNELRFADEAFSYGRQGLKLCEKIPQSDLLTVGILKAMGFVYYLNKNDYEKAKSYFEQALQYTKSLSKDTKRETEANIYSYLGLLNCFTYMNGEKLIEGVNYAHKSLSMLNAEKPFHLKQKSQEKLSFRVVEHKVNLGEIYCLLGEYEKAYELYLKDAAFILDNKYDPYVHAMSKILLNVNMGQYYLRTNQLKKAKEQLTDSLKETAELIHANNGFILRLVVFRAETLIRLDDLNTAYEDCLTAFKEEKAEMTNYSKALMLMAYYHAAFIQYKKGNFSKSWEYFNLFFKKCNNLYQTILEDQKYRVLEEKKAFTINLKEMNQKSLKECFEKSALLFSALYNDTHPFITDYVLKNKV